MRVRTRFARGGGSYALKPGSRLRFTQIIIGRQKLRKVSEEEVWCRHCQSVHASPDCTEGVCIHMMEDAHSREYLSDDYPGGVLAWRASLEEKEGTRAEGNHGETRMSARRYGRNQPNT